MDPKPNLHFLWPNKIYEHEGEFYSKRPFLWNELKNYFDITLYCKVVKKDSINQNVFQKLDNEIDVIDFFHEPAFKYLLKNYQKYKSKIQNLPQDEKYFVMYPYKRRGLLLAWLLKDRDLIIWVKSNSGVTFFPHNNKLVSWLKWFMFPFKKAVYLLISRYIFKKNLIIYTGDIIINKNNHINQHEIISCSPFNQDNGLIKEKETDSIVFVGGESRQKGLTVLLRALRKIPEKRRPSLNIIGLEKLQKPTNKSLADKLNTNIHGVIYDRDLFYEKLSQNDALIMPSFAEKQGKVQLEAMSAGVVPICSDSGGTYMTIDNYYNGLLFQPGNASELSEKIQLLYDHPKLRKSLQENGLAYVDNLSLAKQCRKMAAIINNRFESSND